MRGAAHLRVSPRGGQAPPARAGLGMRRVRWIRIELTSTGGAVCHVAGTGHRVPIVRRVPLATALSLAAEGVPCVVRAAPERSVTGSPVS